jgi:hypothetical protein
MTVFDMIGLAIIIILAMMLGMHTYRQGVMDGTIRVNIAPPDEDSEDAEVTVERGPTQH